MRPLSFGGPSFPAGLPSSAVAPRDALATSLIAHLGPEVGAAAARVLAQPVRTSLANGTHVDVYYNLHEDVLSLRHDGRVKAHAPAAFLTDVELVVNQAGRERVIAEGRKNVHAFVRGNLRAGIPYAELARLKPVAVTYNPYKFSSFVERATLKPLHAAKFVAVIDKLIIAWV